jgi:hypothetical protein
VYRDSVINGCVAKNKGLRMRRAMAVAVVLGVFATGCLGSHKTVVITHPGKTVTNSPGPQPTKTRIKSHPTFQAGTTTTIQPQAGVSMTIMVGVPSKSKTRLSPTYGYGPARGYYVTFPLVIKNSGQTPLLIERLDFYIKTPGLGKVTTNDGNAPYSGSPRQLDTTPLAPGKTLHNNLTFDVSHPSGTFYYAPGNKPTAAWTFGS